MSSRAITVDEQTARLERRKAGLVWTGLVPVRPNAAGRRTPEKRVLLEAIADSAGAQGRAPKFAAKV